MTDTTTSLDVVILSNEFAAYADALCHYENPVLNIVQATDKPEQIDTCSVEIMLADPSLAAEIVDKCDNLQWIQSGWAGNTPLINANNHAYTLTGVKGVFGKQMREYVFSYLLHFARNVGGFQAAQRYEGQPKWCKPEFGYLAGKTLGICGAGSIASSLLDVAQVFDMQVIGLRNSGKAKPGYKAMFSAEQIGEFVAQSDYIVNLLPDTPDTHNIFDKSVFATMRPHCVLINAGRGSAINDQDLIKALNHDQLRGAVLDVFDKEPLPDHHPFWHHKKIVVTQHTAAESDAADIAALFHENAKRYINGDPLNYQFDFNKGY